LMIRRKGRGFLVLAWNNTRTVERKRTNKRKHPQSTIGRRLSVTNSPSVPTTIPERSRTRVSTVLKYDLWKDRKTRLMSRYPARTLGCENVAYALRYTSPSSTAVAAPGLSEVIARSPR